MGNNLFSAPFSPPPSSLSPSNFCITAGATPSPNNHHSNAHHHRQFKFNNDNVSENNQVCFFLMIF
jgi:hypothetical protein